MLNHVTTTLTSIEGQCPGCGIFYCGDFNRLNIKHLAKLFKLKQFVDQPTRGDQTLDLVLTNFPQLYDSLQILPPFGLSEHSVVILRPKYRCTGNGPSRKLITRRDTCMSRKMELGRYLCAIDWSPVELAVSCDEKQKF